MQVSRVAPEWPVPSLMHRRRVMADRIIYVGLDVHKVDVVVAVAEGGGRGDVRDHGRIANTPVALDRLVRKLGREGRPRLTAAVILSGSASDNGSEAEKPFPS